MIGRHGTPSNLAMQRLNDSVLRYIGVRVASHSPYLPTGTFPTDLLSLSLWTYSHSPYGPTVTLPTDLLSLNVWTYCHSPYGPTVTLPMDILSLSLLTWPCSDSYMLQYRLRWCAAVCLHH